MPRGRPRKLHSQPQKPPQYVGDAQTLQEATRFMVRESKLKVSRLSKAQEILPVYFAALVQGDKRTASEAIGSISPYCTPRVRDTVELYSSLVADYVSSTEENLSNITADVIKSVNVETDNELVMALRRFIGCLRDNDFTPMT